MTDFNAVIVQGVMEIIGAGFTVAAVTQREGNGITPAFVVVTSAERIPPRSRNVRNDFGPRATFTATFMSGAWQVGREGYTPSGV